jgi:hypothetical protein
MPCLPTSHRVGVVESTRVTIDLDVDVAGEFLSGHASNGQGAQRDFRGWLGLVGAIDALLDDDNDLEAQEDSP